MNANELLADLRRLNPLHRFAATSNGNAVGYWVEEYARFAPRWWKAEGAKWLDMEGKELLGCDGVSPAFAPGDWVE